MRELLLERGRPRVRLDQLLVVFTGHDADERALDTALAFAGCSGPSLQAALLQGEFRAYSIPPDELKRLQAAWRASAAAVPARS